MLSVIIFGESVGGFSVGLYVLFFCLKDFFYCVIVISGVEFFFYVIGLNIFVVKYIKSLVEVVKCFVYESREIIKCFCLREVGKFLIDIVVNVWRFVVDGDFLLDIFESFRKFGKFNCVIFMVGFIS